MSKDKKHNRSGVRFETEEQLSKFLKNQQVTYDDWRSNPDDYDFMMVDMQVMKEVSMEAALLFSVIDAGYAFTHKELANVFNISESRAANHLLKLKNAGYALSEKRNRKGKDEKFTQEEIKDMLLNRKKLVCEWCKCKTLIIEQHHYPIPQRYGGIDVVDICKNCHVMFHKIEVEQNGGW